MSDTTGAADGGKRVEYRLLGPVEVSRDGAVVPLGRRAQMLLALLLINANEVVSTDRIIDQLWGDDPGRDPQNALWVVVSRLRAALEPDREKRSDGSILLTQVPGYRLVVDDDAIDARVFERLAGEGRRLVEPDPATAVEVLGRALGLWHGHALEAFTYEPFATAAIARLEELRIQAVEDRMEAELRLGHGPDLVGPLDGLVREHPLRQRLVGQHMRALHLSGRQGEALRVFTAAKERLVEEQGLDPSAELVQLEEQILLDDPALYPGAAPGRAPSETVALSVRGYELREKIGTGASSELYRAFQPAVGREVAIEIMRTELANDPDFIRRFEVEAKAIAQLEHPQIVPVFDFWREPDSAYLVTRHFEHGSLRAALAARPLTIEEAAAILQQVGGAVVAAHRRSARHGDITPENVMLDAEHNAYLGSFALSAGPSAEADTEQFAALSDFVLRHTVDTTGQPLAIDESWTAAASVEGVVDHIQRALGEHPAAAPMGDVANPYQGLRAFGEDDAGRFHGRERLIERLVTRLGDSGPQGRFVALVGPSGSGKSSVVRAGVVPALRQGAAIDSDRWFIVTMTPGRRPFESLADAMLGIAINPPADLAERLRADGLALVGERVSPDPAAQIVIVVDQFEELFTQSEDPEEFIDALVKAVTDRHSGIKVIATMRADFYDRPLQHSDLGELLRTGTEVITPMTPDELERAITRPAHNEGVEFETGAVARITADMAGQSAALPLLQHALTELFDNRTGSTITTDSYEELGGVAGALARRADALYANLDRVGRRAARDMFLRLVTVQEGSADTRRRALTKELREVAGPQATDVLQVFGEHRLLSFDQDPATRAPTAEIAHEALLTRWATLSDWIDEARNAVHAQRRLAESARDWTEGDENPDLVLAGSRLQSYDGWLDSPPVPLSTREQAFLQASENAARAELEAERRRVSRLRRLVGVAAGAFVIAAVAAGIAAWQQGKAADAADVAEAQTVVAQEQTARAEAQTEVAEEQTALAEAAAETAEVERMRAQAVAEVGTNPPLAALLAVEAYNVDGSHLSAGSIQGVLTSVDGLQATLFDTSADYSGVSVISADKTVVASSSDLAVDVWDVDARALRLRIETSFARIDMSDDASLLVYSALDADGIRLVEVDSGVEVGAIPSRPCRQFEIAPGGSRLALTTNRSGEFDCDDSTPRVVEIWDIADRSDPALAFESRSGNPWAVAWNPTGSHYLTVDIGGSVHYWDATTHEELWTFAFDKPAEGSEGFISNPTGTLFTSDGSSVVVGAKFGQSARGILLFHLDTATGTLLAEPLSTAGLISMNWWDPEETLVVGTFAPSGVGIFDLARSEEVLPTPMENPNASSVFVDHARNRVVSAGFVGIEISSLDGSATLERRIPLTSEQLAVKAESDGQLFGSMTNDGSGLLMSVLDLSGRSPVVEWDLTTKPPTRVADHPPGFIYSQGDVTVQFGVGPDGPAISVLDGDHQPFGIPAGMELERGFPPLWRSSADGSRHGPVRPELGVIDVYDTTTGERIGEFTIPDRADDDPFFVSSGYSFTDDGSRLVANFGSEKRGLLWAIFDVDSGELLRSGGEDEFGRPWVAGDVIYSNPPGSFDLERFDIDTLEEIGPPLVGHTLILNSIRDDPDGDLIVTQASNGNVRVWDRETGDQIGRAISIGRQAAGTDLATARDNELVGVILDTEFAIWNYDLDSWPALACDIAGRNMTEREWADFGPQGEPYRVTCPQFPAGA
ncbi:MAG: BTAD domain-containing putative transcriptional regulator [Acidimicrobiales bacterium]